MCVQQPNQDQKTHATKVRRARVNPFRLGTPGHQTDTRAEKKREHRHELPIGADVSKKPDREIKRFSPDPALSQKKWSRGKSQAKRGVV
jgi:hypothetical protein